MENPTVKSPSALSQCGLTVRQGIILGVTFFLLRFFFLLRQGMPLSDEVYYVLSARDILLQRDPGDFLMTFNHRQPVLALFFALWKPFSFDPLFQARSLSMVIGCLTAIPFYFLASRLAGQKAACGAVVLYGLASFTIEYSLRAMNHSFFNFFWCCFLLGFVEMILTRRKRWVLVTGLAACGCYFMRVEGFLFFLGLLFWAFCFDFVRPSTGNRSVRSLIPLMAAVFLAGAAPFWVFLKWKTGHWHLTWLEGASEWQFFSTKVPIADGETISIWSFLRGYLRGCATATSGFLKVYGAPFLFFTILGKIADMKIKLLSDPLKTARFAVLPLWVLPVLFYPIHWSEPRFFYPVMLVFLVDAGVGLVLLFEGSFYRVWQGGRLSSQRFRVGCCLALIFIGVLPGWRNLWLSHRDDRPALEAAGRWLEKNAEVESTFFGGDISVCYFAGAACGHFVSLQSQRKFFSQSDFLENLLKSGKIQWVVDDAELMRKDYAAIRGQMAQTLQSSDLTRHYEKDGITLYRVRAA